MDLLVFFVVLALIVFAVVWILGMVPVDARLRQIAYVVLFALVCLALLDRFGIYSIPR